jgi:ABC-2 type transport system permease protein
MLCSTRSTPYGVRRTAYGDRSGDRPLVWPIGFLSGVIVPPQTMPSWLATLADLNPVSATAAACRDLFGNPTGTTEGLLVDHALVLALFVPLTALAYRRLGD